MIDKRKIQDIEDTLSYLTSALEDLQDLPKIQRELMVLMEESTHNIEQLRSLGAEQCEDCQRWFNPEFLSRIGESVMAIHICDNCADSRGRDSSQDLMQIATPQLWSPWTATQRKGRD